MFSRVFSVKNIILYAIQAFWDAPQLCICIRFGGASSKGLSKAQWSHLKTLGFPILAGTLVVRVGQRCIMPSAQVDQWLKSPNPAFDGLTPLQLVERGELDRIWRMVHELKSDQPG
jgi:hypothetical protein